MRHLILAALAVFLLSSCTATQRGAAVGAGVGATAGAITTGNPRGAAVGAAIGAATGALIGKTTEGKCIYRRPNGTRYVANC